MQKINMPMFRVTYFLTVRRADRNRRDNCGNYSSFISRINIIFTFTRKVLKTDRKHPDI